MDAHRYQVYGLTIEIPFACPDLAPADANVDVVVEEGPVAAVSATALAGGLKFDALLGCVHGPVLGDEHPALFSLLTAVLEQVTLFDLQRPDDRWSIGEVIDCIVRSGRAGRDGRRQPFGYVDGIGVGSDAT